MDTVMGGFDDSRFGCVQPRLVCNNNNAFGLGAGIWLPAMIH